MWPAPFNEASEVQGRTLPGPRVRTSLAGNFAALAAAGLLSFCTAHQGPEKEPASDPPAGTVWIPGDEFTMGSDGPESWPSERPAHRVRVSGFRMDETEVTNARFAEFTAATNYLTVAERPVDWEELRKQVPPGTPKPAEEMLRPGSLVFTPTKQPVPLDDHNAWWSWMPGADWRHPEGPGTDLAGREEHPVVQVAWADADAYCSWAGKRLPTEAEWEIAARGGREGERFVWGDELLPEGRPMANIWQGRFPNHNTEQDGHFRTAPVRSFPPNRFGLYDMAGNVWEWCSDRFRPDTYSLQVRRWRDRPVANPVGPDQSWNPREPLVPSRSTRGGSFLCHASYCESYRPSARRGTAADSGLSHLGFRCVAAGQK